MRKRLRLRILERYDTQDNFAKVTGISPQTVSTIISGHGNPSRTTCKVFMEALDLTYPELIGLLMEGGTN